jgi:hypothetical protein
LRRYLCPTVSAGTQGGLAALRRPRGDTAPLRLLKFVSKKLSTQFANDNKEVFFAD